MSRRLVIGAAAIAFALALPACALAAEASTPATQTYDLSFTLPTVGVSGCTVCHADPNLVRVDDAETTTTSIYTDPAEFAETAHADTLCTGCHVDFAFETPHANVEGDDWREVAGSACKSCHDQAFSAVTAGAHSPTSEPGVSAEQARAARVAAGKPAEVPICGDCHGSHDIQYLDVERWEESTATADTAEAAREGRADMHSQGLEICGSCHVAEAGNYADYYHGAAYQEGAPDAPACWDCHGTHEMLPADDLESPVHPNNLIETCGKCHDDVNEEYVEYAQLVHRKDEVEDEIPLYTILGDVKAAIQGAFDAVAGLFTQG